MPLYRWTSTEPGPHDKGIKEEATKPTRGIKDESPHSGKEEDRNPIDPLTEILHQEGHASNAGKWDILLEIALGGRRRRASTSLTIVRATSPLISHRPPCQETTWPR